MRTNYSASYAKFKEQWGRKPPYAIYPILPIGEVTALAAQAGLGKSTFASFLAVFLAGEKSNDILKSENSGATLFILPEAAEVVVSGIDGAAKTLGVSEQTVEDRFIPIFADDLGPWAKPQSTDFIEKMGEEIRKHNSERGEANRIRLVIFDSAYFGLNGDPKDTIIADSVMSNLSVLARRERVAILVILHGQKKLADYSGAAVWRDRACEMLILRQRGNRENEREIVGSGGKLKNRHGTDFRGLTYSFHRDEEKLPVLSGFQRYTKIVEKKTEKQVNGVAREPKSQPKTKIGTLLAMMDSEGRMTSQRFKELAEKAGYDSSDFKRLNAIKQIVISKGWEVSGDLRKGTFSKSTK